jgi:hypothetical protein
MVQGGRAAPFSPRASCEIKVVCRARQTASALAAGPAGKAYAATGVPWQGCPPLLIGLDSPVDVHGCSSRSTPTTNHRYRYSHFRPPCPQLFAQLNHPASLHSFHVPVDRFQSILLACVQRRELCRHVNGEASVRNW